MCQFEVSGLRVCHALLAETSPGDRLQQNHQVQHQNACFCGHSCLAEVLTLLLQKQAIFAKGGTPTGPRVWWKRCPIRQEQDRAAAPSQTHPRSCHAALQSQQAPAPMV